MATTKAKEDVWVKTFCHGCLSATCGLKVHRVDGVVVGIEGDPDNPYNRGKLCAKAYAQIMTLYDPHRPKGPLVRTNPEKGIGVDPKWREASWEEALNLASKKLAETRKTNPADLLLSSADISSITWMPAPILMSFGSPNWTYTPGYYCASAVHTVPYQTMGCFHVYPDHEYCNFLVLWGSNEGGILQHTGVTAALDIAEARMKRGMKVISIDPVQSNMAAKADEWVPILPGTDLAMALAWLHVLLHEAKIYDEEFLKRYTNAPYLVMPDGHYIRDKATNKPMMWDPIDGMAKTYDAEFKDVAIEGTYQVLPAMELVADGGNGAPRSVVVEGSGQAQGVSCRPAFELLKEHVKPLTPEWAAPITTVSAETARRLAKEFGEAARIGSTIKHDGHVLPYRPAAVHWFSGISQHVNGYATSMALQLINTMVGNLDVPGGMSGESTVVQFPYGKPTAWTGKDGEPTAIDGLFVASAYARFDGVIRTGYPATRVVPPKTHSASELLPVGMGGGNALLELNNLHPEVFNHQLPKPKVLLGRQASDVICKGNPNEMASILKNLYQISCEPLVDEMAEFADVFLPVPVRLERLQLGTELGGYAGGTINLNHYCINLSQPVVPSAGRDMMDIWGEIADRVGFRSDYNQMINVIWDLQGEQRLDLDKKYTYQEMQERFCKSLFGPESDLDTLGKDGHVKWKKNVKERYPRAFIEPRAPIYYEHFLDAGEELGRVTGELGIKWDLKDYNPLPAWHPGPAHREARSEFNLFAIPFRVPFLMHAWQTHNPWLTELADAHPWAFKILMNAATGVKHGIKDGDQIEVAGGTGYKVEGKVKLTQCVHPEVVAICRHGGHWARHPISRGKGVHFNTLIPHTQEYMDVMYGGNLEACVKVKVTKAAAK